MASDGAKKLVKYMQESGICSNPSLFGTLEEDFHGFLTNAKPVLSEFEHRDYKLEQHDTTCKLRYKLVKCFIEKKKSEGLRLTSVSQSKEFFVELKQFADDSESEEDLSDLDLDQRRQHRVRGVVAWKSNKKANACVKEDHRRQGDTGSFSLSELSVNFLNENDTDHEGFHLQLAVGDIVEVTKCSRKDGIALEQDIEKCCLSDTKIESFLRHLSNYAKNNGSSATAIEITRFSTFWEYILNLSKDKLTNEIILQILEIINKVCSVVPMSPTVIAIVQGFQQSMLFRSVLPNFINELTVEDVKSHISILQKILEHVITAVPASGLQVSQMATDLAHNLVMDSNELEAKKSGHSAIEFLSKLCSIIASKEDGLQVYQVCPPAGTFYMQPLVQEDGLQVYQVCPPAGTFYMQPLVQPGQPVFFMQQMRPLWQPMQQLQQMRPSAMQVSGDGQIPRAKGIHQVPPRQMPGQQEQLPHRPSYKSRQPQPHPSTAPMQQQERFEPPICIPGQKPLYRSVLASVSRSEQKQMLGERLFSLIQATHPDQAGKITGMLLEIDNTELLHMLECREALYAKTQEAVSVLKAHNAKVRMEKVQFKYGV